jgi:hypothetical protein
MDQAGAALEGIDGLRVFPYSADRITPPAAIVGWPEMITYDATMARGMDRQSVPVWVIVGRVDARSARDELAAYLDGSGSRSVKAALDDGIYTACHTVRVATATVQTFTFAGVEYIGAEFIVDITGAGA